MTKIREIITVDPKIILENNEILIKPFYWNYSFITNFVCIGILSYAMILNRDDLLDMIAYILIGVAIITMLMQLRHYNTTYIQTEKKVLTIYPNWFFGIFLKSKSIEFTAVKRIITVSNYKASGYWIMNRRYYVIIELKNREEIKLISSNKENTAREISELITSLL